MSEQEKTDRKKVVDAFKISENAAKGASSPKWSPEHKMAILMGTVLLGGTAFVAIEKLRNGGVAEPDSSDTDEGAAESDSAGTQSSLAQGVEHTVPGGTIIPGEGINISSSHVTDRMSFGEAFNEARAECGPGSIFEWRGNVYNTYYREEWIHLSKEDKQEFLNRVGFRPGIKTPEQPEPEVPKLADYRITEQDGWQITSYDENHDGIVDRVIARNSETGEYRMLTDNTGDGTLDSVYDLDPSNLESTYHHHLELDTITLNQIDTEGSAGVVIEGIDLVHRYEEYDFVEYAESGGLEAAEAVAEVAVVEEDVQAPVDSMTNEVVYNAEPIQDEDYNNGTDVI